MSIARRTVQVGELILIPALLAMELGAQSLELPALDSPLEVGIEHIATLGTFEGGDWDAFGRLRAVAFGPEGDLFILDQQAAQVHRVSASGEYLGSVGRKGGGPGEYELPTGMRVAPDGRVLVRDTRRASWTVFGPDGTYLENLRLDGSLGRPASLRIRRDGSIVGVPNEVLMVEAGRLKRTYMVDGAASLPDAERLPLIALDADGQAPHILSEMRLPERQAVNGQVVETAFLSGFTWDLLPDGRVVVADSVVWELRVVGSAETPDLRIWRSIPPMAVTAQMRENEIERRAALPSGGWSGGAVSSGGTAPEGREAIVRATAERLRSGLRFADVRPAIRRIMTDPEGRIWVSRTPESVDRGAPGLVDVLDASGRYLGTVSDFSLPDAVGPDGLMAWIGTGEFDIPLVTIRRVTIPR